MSEVEQQFAIREITRSGRPLRVFEENFACVSQMLAMLDQYTEREFIVQDERRLTFAGCKRGAAKLAHHLRVRHGVEPGNRVALSLPNSIEWILGFIAIVSLGAVPTLVNARAGRDEFHHCLESTGCVLCLHGASNAPASIPGLALEEVQSIVADSNEATLPMVSCDAGDEALVMFTSGTTGLPKAASLSHLAVATSLKTMQYSGALIAEQMAKTYGIDYAALVRMRPPPVNLLVFPLFHVSGCHAVFLSSLLQGGKIVVLGRWDAEQALALIQDEKITAFPAVPTMYRDVLAHPRRAEFDLSSLTSLSVGGQATPPALLEEVHAAFPGAILGTGYGMTEANGTVCMFVGEGFINNPQAVGRPVSTLDIEIRDDAGKQVEIGGQGEVFVRGAAVMTGYIGVEQTGLDEFGWFATGDIGRTDEDGLLYVLDRKTDMVISGGENIYCAEVERVVELHPAVHECAAVGLPDERLGEKVVAVAALNGTENLVEADLTAHCLAHLARHKVPKEIVVQHEALPRNPAGKLVKKEIRTRFFGDRL